MAAGPYVLITSTFQKT